MYVHTVAWPRVGQLQGIAENKKKTLTPPAGGTKEAPPRRQ